MGGAFDVRADGLSRAIICLMDTGESQLKGVVKGAPVYPMLFLALPSCSEISMALVGQPSICQIDEDAQDGRKDSCGVRGNSEYLSHILPLNTWLTLPWRAGMPKNNTKS